MEALEFALMHCLDDCNDGVVKEAALYSLISGGKRIRPRLLFSVLNAYQVSQNKGMNAACAIEMIHTYSLIHDDLPAMDDDTLRRGKPTCHVKYGEAMAILAGDALLTHAFSMMANACEDASKNILLVKELALNSGLNGMILGQELDLLNENNPDIDMNKLASIHYHKTGNLIVLPLVCGAILADHNEDIEKLRELGFLVGLLFQIQDDVFDVIKTSEQLGKNANSDADNEKITYASLLGMEECQKQIEKLYEKAISLLNQIAFLDQKPVRNMLEILLHRNN